MKHMHTLPLALLVAALASCGSENPVEPTPEPEPPVTPPSLTLTRLEGPLTPGTTVTLIGKSLPDLATLSIDGTEVTDFNTTSDSSATFTVPELRRCETDGRSVSISASDSNGNNRSLTAAVKVHPDSLISMSVGESRDLTAEDLSGCWQFPAEQGYVIWALNPTIQTVIGNPEAALPVHFTTFRTWTTSPDTIALPGATLLPSYSLVQNSKPMPKQGHQASPSSSSTWPRYEYLDNPVPFDPSYETAQVGDTVRFVAWDAMDFNHLCKMDRQTVYNDTILSYPAEVAAVAGNIAIVVDLRGPLADKHLSPDGIAALQHAADITAPLLIPTMREVFDPAFEPRPAAGGRMYAIITPIEDAAGTASDGFTDFSQPYCPLASEMVTVRITDSTGGDQRLEARGTAAILIHEYAHNAATITAYRMNPYNFTKTGFWEEALPTIAEGVALRIAMDQPMGANPTLSSYIDAPATWPRTQAGQRCRWARCAEYNLVDYSAHDSRYHASTGLYTYASERFGDAAIGSYGPNGKTLYQTFQVQLSDYDLELAIGTVASAIGYTTDRLLEESAIAYTITDLIDPVIAKENGLPIIQTWSLSKEYWPKPVPRNTNQKFTLAAAPGSFAATYLLPQDSNALSLEFKDANPSADMKARLIRLH